MKELEKLKIGGKLFLPLYCIGAMAVVVALALVGVMPVVVIIAGAIVFIASCAACVTLKKHVTGGLEELSRGLDNTFEAKKGLEAEVSRLTENEKTYEKMAEGLLSVVSSYARGDFKTTVSFYGNFPAAKGLSEEFTRLANNSQNVLRLAAEAAKNAESGVYTGLPEMNFEGMFKDTSAAINSCFRKTSEFLAEAEAAVAKLNAGEYNVRLNETGGFSGFAGKINALAAKNSGFAAETANIFNAIAKNDLSVSYKNADENVKKAAEAAFREIGAMSRRLSQAEGSIASVKNTYAELEALTYSVSQRQAGLIQNLGSNIENVKHEILDGSKNTGEAFGIAKSAVDKCGKGAKSLNGMIEAMREINVLSGNISNVIESIDNISFQTQLLALNASIEAARAGQFGKGFSIVATNVGELAGKSKEAANETSNLLDGMLGKFKESMEFLVDVDKAVSGFVSDIDVISAVLSRTVKNFDEGIVKLNEISSNARDLSGMAGEIQAGGSHAGGSHADMVYQTPVVRTPARHEVEKEASRPINIEPKTTPKAVYKPQSSTVVPAKTTQNTPVLTPSQKPAATTSPVKTYNKPEPKVEVKPQSSTIGSAKTPIKTPVNSAKIYSKPEPKAIVKPQSLSSTVKPANTTPKPPTLAQSQKPAVPASSTPKFTSVAQGALPSVKPTAGQSLKPTVSSVQNKDADDKKVSKSPAAGLGIGKEYNKKDFGKY